MTEFDNAIRQYMSEADESRRTFLKRAAIGTAAVGAGYALWDNCPDRVISATRAPLNVNGHIVTPTLFNYLISQENHRAKGRNRSCMWFPHKSYEGGLPTLGYGHKFATSQEYDMWLRQYPDGMTQEQIEQLLINDISKHAARGRQYVDSRFGGGVWNKLPQNSKDMLTDMAFNPGIEEFPTFTGAVVSNDWGLAKQEYSRRSGDIPLARRNNAFFKTFLQNN